MRRVLVIVTLAVVLLAVPAGASSGRSGKDGRLYFTSGSRPFGTSFSQWSARWSEWAFGLPVPRNPLADPANCNVGQHGPVFLLPAAIGPDTVASCSVPEGKGVLVTPGGSITSTATGDGTTGRQLAKAAKAATDVLSDFSASVDGVALPVTRFRTSALFTLALPRNNLFGVPGGDTRAAINGYFMILKPLPVGTHTITESDTFADGSIDNITITVNVEASA
jgi:hypothetical protein